jgi:hypothetical protein
MPSHGQEECVIFDPKASAFAPLRFEHRTDAPPTPTPAQVFATGIEW